MRLIVKFLKAKLKGAHDQHSASLYAKRLEHLAKGHGELYSSQTTTTYWGKGDGYHQRD